MILPWSQTEKWSWKPQFWSAAYSLKMQQNKSLLAKKRYSIGTGPTKKLRSSSPKRNTTWKHAKAFHGLKAGEVPKPIHSPSTSVGFSTGKWFPWGLLLVIETSNSRCRKESKRLTRLAAPRMDNRDFVLAALWRCAKYPTVLMAITTYHKSSTPVPLRKWFFFGRRERGGTDGVERGIARTTFAYKCNYSEL